jgi:hypothetical protein
MNVTAPIYYKITHYILIISSGRQFLISVPYQALNLCTGRQFISQDTTSQIQLIISTKQKNKEHRALDCSMRMADGKIPQFS